MCQVAQSSPKQRLR